MKIAIDWGLDWGSKQHGQFRYAVDLIKGLIVHPKINRLIVFGTKFSPPNDLKDFFKAYKTKAKWVWKPKYSGRLSKIINSTIFFCYATLNKFDLLHIIDSEITLIKKSKVVITIYDCIKLAFPDQYREEITAKYFQDYWNLTLNKSDLLITISQSSRNDFIKYWGVSNNKVKVVYLGSGLVDEISSNQKYSNISYKFTENLIISPFNLEPRKNLDALLYAMVLIKNDFPSIKLLLYGKAAWSHIREQNFNNLVHKLNLSKNIELLGFLEDSALAEVMQKAQVFVFPSLYEGFGLPVLEAMGFGLPVVACDKSSMPEIVGDAGILIKSGSSFEIAESVCKILADTKLRGFISRKALQRSKEFSVSRMIEDTLDIYNTALAGQIK